LATRVHGFSTKTKALAREIPPVTQATHIKSVKVYIRAHLAITQHWKSTGFMVSAKGAPDTCRWEKEDRKVRMVKQKENK